MHKPQQSAPSFPFVSVIMPVFNGERFVTQAIESVLAQDYRPIEIIAIDDGSSDGTLDLLRAQLGVSCLQQAHRGASAAYNTGIASARGSILAFIDSDDLWPSNRLAIAVAHLEAHPEVDYVLGRQLLFAEAGYEIPPWVKPEWLTTPQDASNTGALVARREAFSRVGPFNTDYEAGEDTEWLVRASELGLRLARLPEVLIHARLHGANLSVANHPSREAIVRRIARESILRRRTSTRA